MFRAETGLLFQEGFLHTMEESATNMVIIRNYFLACIYFGKLLHYLYGIPDKQHS